MKYLIMCEGANEKKIIEILMKNQKLKIDYDDLVGRQVYQARQIKNNPNVTTPLKIYGGKVEILRIGDKQSDEIIKIAKNYYPNAKITSIKDLNGYDRYIFIENE